MAREGEFNGARGVASAGDGGAGAEKRRENVGFSRL